MPYRRSPVGTKNPTYRTVSNDEKQHTCRGFRDSYAKSTTSTAGQRHIPDLSAVPSTFNNSPARVRPGTQASTPSAFAHEIIPSWYQAHFSTAVAKNRFRRAHQTDFNIGIPLRDHHSQAHLGAKGCHRGEFVTRITQELDLPPNHVGIRATLRISPLRSSLTLMYIDSKRIHTVPTGVQLKCNSQESDRFGPPI